MTIDGLLGQQFGQVMSRCRVGESSQSFMLGDYSVRSTPDPFIYHLTEKDPFRLPSIDKLYPFHPHTVNPLLSPPLK